jgi:phosphoglycerate dehydrogenase-like enzyme
MKLILPIEIKDALLPLLPTDLETVWVDRHGNFVGDPSDAEVYFNGFYLKRGVLRHVLAAAPDLRWQHSPSAGVEHILIPEFLQRHILLTNSAGIYAIPIAETVLGYILHHAKRFSDLQTMQAQKRWQWNFELEELTDKTMLIIGAGGIGQAIATRASAFGMRVWGVRRRPKELPGFERVVGFIEWRSLLPEADYVVVAAPLTAETKGMIDRTALQTMRQTSYLINIARGGLIDETALLEALQLRWIGGAAIDTFVTEPLPVDSPFWLLPDVFVTPHCSGASPKTLQRTIDLFLDNFDRYRQGLPLRNQVDPQVGY